MKVLLISHNCFSTHQSMGKTFLSLFSAFKKEELCQLYIYPTVPDVDVCDSYYRVTDKEILHSFFGLKKTGGEIEKSKIENAKHELFENSEDVSVYRNKSNKSGFKRLLRDFMWKTAHWYNKELAEWVKVQKPTCIFLSPGYAKFVYDIALKISKQFNLPIITYICDDYYFVKSPSGIIDKLQFSLLCKKTREIMSKTSHLITICEEIKTEYTKEFKVPATVVMTGYNITPATASRCSKNPTAISYFGNISCSRYLSLAELGRELDKLNAEKGTNFEFRIYTAENDPEMLSVFDDIKSVRMMGFVSGDEFRQKFDEAELLLHSEGFSEESIDLVKHSVSTKIADSLASGKLLLAYGPDSVASMKHLIRNDCALCATSKEDLKDMLLDAFFSFEKCEKVVANALKTVEAYHNTPYSSAKLKKIFGDISNE